MYLDNDIFKSSSFIESSSSSPLILSGSDKTYQIVSGKVDIFAVMNRDGDGRRFHIATLQEGELCFGLPLEESLSIIAVSHLGAKICFKETKEVLSYLIESKNMKPLHHWLERISKYIYNDLSQPKQFINLNEIKTNFKEGESLRILDDDLLWLKVNSGEAYLCGVSSWRLSEELDYMPISKRMWVKAGKSFDAEVLKTESLFQNIQIEKAMGCFGDFFLLAVKSKLFSIEEKERLQVNKKLLIEKNKNEQSLLQLANVMDTQYEQFLINKDKIDPLSAACQIVGDYLKIEIKEHPDSKNKGFQNSMEKIAKASAVRIRRVMLFEEWYTKDNGPLIGFIEENEKTDKKPVALIPQGNRGYKMIDPQTKETKIVSDEIAMAFEGFAYMLYRPLPNKELNIKDIYKFASFDIKKDMFFIILMGLFVGILGMATPIFTGKIYDMVIPESNKEQLVQIAGALIAIAFSTALFTFVRGIASARLKGKMSMGLQCAIWDRLLALPAPFFRKYSTGELAERANGINAIQEMLSGTVLASFLNGIFSIFSLALLFYYNVKLALIAMVLVLIAMIYTFVSAYFQMRYMNQILKFDGKIQGLILQLLSGIQKLRVAGAEGRAFGVWADNYSKRQKLSFKAGNLQNHLEVFNTIFPTLTTIIIFATVAYFLKKDAQFTTGEFIAFNAAFGQFTAAALAMSGVAIQVLEVFPIYKRITPILKTKPEIDSAKSDPGELSGNIVLNKVYFRYKDEGLDILKGISLSIEPGQFVAFVGPSGSGKSTILRILLGFEKALSGTVYYDEQNLAELDIGSVRSQIGTVLQNGQIMQGDIFNNIVGSTGLSIQDAWEAAKMAGFDEDIKQMPMGMHTVVSSGGGTLSGGQRQRLLISRALITKPRIIFFDEATSALDNKTQAIVTKSLDKLDVTRVVIAHRLSTIINADKIYVIKDGEILQCGNYDQLMSEEGLFKELASRQVA